jgi:hypothetical protein
LWKPREPPRRRRAPDPQAGRVRAPAHAALTGSHDPLARRAPCPSEAAGEQLTELLEGHINGAVELLGAAKAGDQKQVKQASAAWYRNGNQIADFLSEANPDNWPRKEMRSMMRTHLDQTLAEATQRLEGDHEAEVRTYDEIHVHILEMADALSDGIVAQFPERFE